MFHRAFSIVRRNIDFLRRKDISAFNRELRIIRFLFFIRLHGLDLTSVSLQELDLSAAKSNSYSNSGGPDLEKVLEKQDITSDDCILDIGCGKGGALFTMKKYPFREIDGLDISEELLDIAEKNIQRLGFTNCTLIHADAESFSDYNKYTYFYFCNPFPSDVMQRVIENIIRSLDNFPRRVKIIYSSPAYHDVIIQSGRFWQIEKYVYSDIDFHISCNVYVNMPESGNDTGVMQYPL